MKEYKSQIRYAKTSAQKARLVINQIRGQDVSKAKNILNFSDKRAAVMIGKCLDSAVANAEFDKADKRDLVVTRCFVDEAPTRKGWIPRSRGMANPLLFRSSHITVCVSQKESK